MEGVPGDVSPTGPEQRPELLRVSDQERHAVAEVLREAAGEGRLTLAELEERLDATFAARTYADLVPITADLPQGGTPPVPAGRRTPVPAAGPAFARSVAVLSETRRRGPWNPGADHLAVAFLGSVVLDLREVALPAELHITATAVLGSVEVWVDESTRLVLDGVAVLGEFGEARSRVSAELTADSPVVRVDGLALLGSVEGKRKRRPALPR